MTPWPRERYGDLWSDNAKARYDALVALLAATETPVDWADEVWDDLVGKLDHPDNHVRAIAGQLLSHLARNEPDGRIEAAFPALLAVTRDRRFVTARHTLQALWRVGLGGEAARALLLDGLARRFEECAAEKNATLIRHDIADALGRLYDETGDERVKARALDLIATETNDKYRRRYAGLWKKR